MSGKTYKPKAISGFPEWLPETRLVEQQWLDHIRKVFESYGFCSIETPSVEEHAVIAAKGEVDKEIYVLERLHKEEGDKEARLALHFDQTVPLARYVAQHFNDLIFPFKRYQMQRVWRGERPQLGRAREFYQCDIDVIAQDTLPLHFDAEMPAVIYEALDGLNIGKFQIRISNRKIVLGLLESLGIKDPAPVTRIVDKLDKLKRQEVEKLLQDETGLSKEQTDSILALATAEDISAIKPANEVMAEGLSELSFVMDQLKHLPEHAVKADLSIVRGLDYYTGTVYETRLLDIPEFTSSICSGGRYDDLASSYINKNLPGVGISIGFTRLFEVLNHYDYIKTGSKSPADILMVLPSDERREIAAQTAQTLRKNGFNVEMFHSGSKLKRQMAYAEKKGIPYVWFPPFEDGSPHEVKCMESGEQSKADPENWSPVK
ncbi:MAG: histidine--tRNA ligase [Micavibrio sp.]|nr:MAG: histidine--tRNA ligase [Micavibrio sp.]